MFEVISTNPGLAAALMVTGAAIGVLVASVVLPGPKRVRQLEEELEKAHKEHEAYQSGVTAHFKTTAELVGEMTQSYKAVYDHLAYGAQSLCGEYDALTSSVFGPPRIIHDPKMAVGETLSADAAASATGPAADAVDPTDEPKVAAAETPDGEQATSPTSAEKPFSMGDAHGEDTAQARAESAEQSPQAARATPPTQSDGDTTGTHRGPQSESGNAA